MQSSSRKRKSLTISEKYAIIEYRDNSPNESLENLATRFNCGRSTVSEILGKQRQGIIDSYQAGSRNVQAKRQRKVKLDDVDRNLLNWCVGAFNANLEGITRDTLLNKAQSIARELDYSDEAICGINLDWRVSLLKSASKQKILLTMKAESSMNYRFRSLALQAR